MYTHVPDVPTASQICTIPWIWPARAGVATSKTRGAAPRSRTVENAKARMALFRILLFMNGLLVVTDADSSPRDVPPGEREGEVRVDSVRITGGAEVGDAGRGDVRQERVEGAVPVQVAGRDLAREATVRRGQRMRETDLLGRVPRSHPHGCRRSVSPGSHDPSPPVPPGAPGRGRNANEAPKAPPADPVTGLIGHSSRRTRRVAPRRKVRARREDLRPRWGSRPKPAAGLAPSEGPPPSRHPPSGGRPAGPPSSRILTRDPALGASEPGPARVSRGGWQASESRQAAGRAGGEWRPPLTGDRAYLHPRSCPSIRLRSLFSESTGTASG